MISAFVREQKRYTQNELCEIFECSDSKAVGIIRKLKEYGVLKVVKASDIQKDLSNLNDEEIEIADVELEEADYLYVFTFVGVITVAGIVLKCYPKYLLNEIRPVRELQQILKVLEKYNSKEQIIRMFNEANESKSFNRLAVILFLMNDYYENGVYTNTEEVIECNGLGEILWDKTINETFMLLSNNRPYYVKYQTRKRIDDEYDFFKRLHKCVLTEASNDMQEADLMELFDVTEIDLSDEKLEDFGEKDYILYRIEGELNTQFNTRKQLVLKILYAYIDRRGHLADMDCFSMFGTNNFNHVWESVCADILDNKLSSKLCTLKLPVKLSSEYDGESKLIEIIEKPMWTASGETAKDTLVPDLITISGQDFLIFDAKYYNAILIEGKQPKNQPGIESITKQYLYQLSYQKFIKDHNFSTVKNCFLLPVEGTEFINKGEVKLKMLEAIGLENIKVRQVPATVAYGCYLSGKTMCIQDLALEID